MKLIRWLLSNIILIAFVLALTYAYVYWDNLTGEDTPAGKMIAYLSVEYDEVREFLDSYDFGEDTSDFVEPAPAPAPDVAATVSVPQVQPPSTAQIRPPAQQPVMRQQPPARQQPYQPPARPGDEAGAAGEATALPATGPGDEAAAAGEATALPATGPGDEAGATGEATALPATGPGHEAAAAGETAALPATGAGDDTTTACTVTCTSTNAGNEPATAGGFSCEHNNGYNDRKPGEEHA